MKFRDHTIVEADVLRLAARPGGVSSSEVTTIGYTAQQISHRICVMRDAGKVFTGTAGHKKCRHFTTAEAAQQWAERREAARAPTFRADRTLKRLDPNAPAMIPAGLKITQCPGYTGDSRFAPSPGFERVITADWRARRLQETKPKEE